MNVTFRLPTEDLEKLFVKESTAAGFDGLKGHRSVGGLRASIYNAFPEDGRDRARGVHAGVRADERLGSFQFLVPGSRLGPEPCLAVPVAGPAEAPSAASRRLRRRRRVRGGLGRPSPAVLGRRRPGGCRAVPARLPPALHHVRRVAVDVEPRQRVGERRTMRAGCAPRAAESPARRAAARDRQSAAAARHRARATGSMPKLTRSACGSRARPLPIAGREQAKRLQQRADRARRS